MNDLQNDTQIRALFFNSAQDYLQGMNQALLLLEADGQNKNAIETIFRKAHSLKSESLSMGYGMISEVCHKAEDLFAKIRDENKVIEKDGFSILFQIFDYLENSLQALNKNQGETDNGEVLSKLALLQEKHLINAHDLHIDEENPNDIAENKLLYLRVSIRILDKIMNISEELIIQRMKLSEITQSKNLELLPVVEKKIDLLISELQYYVTQSRLTPIEDIFVKLPRVVRDLSNNLGKKVDIELDLSNLKVDRLIAESLYEPVIHLIRNALDHGIEGNEERKRLGKTPNGKIKIKASSERGLARIEISDDGRGINYQKIKEKISQKNPEIRNLENNEQILELMFQGGISTAESVTNISGRGVGLNVVKSVLDRVGGSVQVKSVVNGGTTFILEFPFTLAIIKAMLVRVVGNLYAIPVTHIVETVMLSPNEVQEVADLKAFIYHEEEIPLVSLSHLFASQVQSYDKQLRIVIIKNIQEKVGLIVDEVISLEEVIVKPIGDYKEESYFSGVTILGSQKTALVMDVPELTRIVLSKSVDKKD